MFKDSTATAGLDWCWDTPPVLRRWLSVGQQLLRRPFYSDQVLATLALSAGARMTTSNPPANSKQISYASAHSQVHQHRRSPPGVPGLHPPLVSTPPQPYLPTHYFATHLHAHHAHIVIVAVPDPLSCLLRVPASPQPPLHSQTRRRTSSSCWTAASWRPQLTSACWCTCCCAPTASTGRRQTGASSRWGPRLAAVAVSES